ncbi:general secretion pathway protein J [Andreprevotia lacus DSM 23236]|jgi:general secretion pathway protein J|uniref:Type II secretion system protein J n=1 Tax=Andreprevotia lacus DSM 23236 TaxID=1121001 RepID=A0A1W1XPJ0_9NEIS|nr:type II secretion system minor pseudopilin GspJ [Andreprevotia lacus]SMC25797.1 general secretion pathway protein J [Andreprevotia lacus DSM 23236]
MRRTDSAGFTLLEVLIALTVFAILTLVAYQGLSRIADTKLRLDEEAQRWRSLSLVLDRFEEDATQVINRPWRDTGGTLQAAVLGGAEAANAGQPVLELVRVGRDRDPYHVAYRLKDGRLEMLQWDSLDLAPRAEPQAYVLMPDVERFAVWFLDADNTWQANWPYRQPGGKVASLTPPRGIKVQLTRKGEPMVERIYALP